MVGVKKINHSDHFPAFLENIIIVSILLVIIHTITEDIGIIYSWSPTTMDIIMVLGFMFDLFFTMEFIGRSVISNKMGQLGYYIKYQRGWVDALTSIPLLLLVSGPSLVLYLKGSDSAMAGFGFLSILKTAKAIRVTRILRLIRVLKLFGKIQNTDSKMTNQHIGSIATISVVTLVVVLVITQFIPFARVGDHYEYLKSREGELKVLLNENVDRDWLKSYLAKSESNRDIIELRDINDSLLYENPDKKDLMQKAYHNGAFIKINDQYKVVLSYFPAEILHAKTNMIVFISILGVILSVMFLYSRIFVQQVSDPIYVMNKGFRDWDYNLAVRVDENFDDEEIFELARVYNSRWLPLKNQIRAYRKKREVTDTKSDIKLDDLI